MYSLFISDMEYPYIYLLTFSLYMYFIVVRALSLRPTLSRFLNVQYSIVNYRHNVVTNPTHPELLKL